MFTKYPDPEAVIADIRRIAAKTGQPEIANDLIDDLRSGTVEAVGFGYFGEKGSLVFQEGGHDTLWLHAVWSHEIGLDEAISVSLELAKRRKMQFVKCRTVRSGLAFKLVKRGWTATLIRRVN